MGVLMSRVWAKLFGTNEHKLCIVGLDNSGKTTTLYSLHLGEVVATQPTIGSNVEEITHKNIKLVAWDLGGQEQLRNTWNTYFIHTAALVFIVDSTDRDRISICREELKRCLDLDTLSNSCILIYANKQDIKGAMSAAEISTALDLFAIKDHAWHIQESCALTGDGLLEGLDWVVENIGSKGNI